jgi:hypothetical protein
MDQPLCCGAACAAAAACGLCSYCVLDWAVCWAGGWWLVAGGWLVVLRSLTKFPCLSAALSASLYELVSSILVATQHLFFVFVDQHASTPRKQFESSAPRADTPHPPPNPNQTTNNEQLPLRPPISSTPPPHCLIVDAVEEGRFGGRQE